MGLMESPLFTMATLWHPRSSLKMSSKQLTNMPSQNHSMSPKIQIINIFLQSQVHLTLWFYSPQKRVVHLLLILLAPSFRHVIQPLWCKIKKGYWHWLTIVSFGALQSSMEHLSCWSHRKRIKRNVLKWDLWLFNLIPGIQSSCP